MSNNLVEQISGITNQMLSVANNLQKINNDTVQSLVSRQFSDMESFLSTSTRQFQELSQIKTPEEAVSAQLKIANEIGESMKARTQENIDVLTKSQAQLETLVQDEIKALIEQAKAVAV
ncbi:MAG: phasin family protein [Magnetococcales bacterium]|nr:phasin family protein [Magnetococcales bacterium]